MFPVPNNSDRFETRRVANATIPDGMFSLFSETRCVEVFNSKYQYMLKNALRKPEYLNSSVDLILEGRHECLKRITIILQLQQS
jgi:hypothetical protein